MNKKFMSIAMASVLAVSAMSMSVSASSGIESKNTFEIDASLNQPKVNATIPASVVAYINPYKASVSLTTGTGVAANVAFNSGIVSPTYSITNTDANMGLAVSATPVITPSETVTVATKPLKGNETEKVVFAYLNTTALESADNVPLFLDTTYDKTKAHQVAFAEEAATKDNILVLAKKDSDGDVGYFRVEGDCSAKPEEAWTDSDTVKMNLVLDLVPSSGKEKDVTITGIKGATSDSQKIADATALAAGSDFTCKATGSSTVDIIVTVTDKTEANLATPTIKVYSSLNGAKPTAATAQSKKEEFKVNKPSGDYNVGDVLTIIVNNGIYSKSYTITFTA